MAIIISNPKEFERKRKIIIKEGFGKIHVISDFDRTLTRHCVKGRQIPSMISVLRDENYLTEDYSNQAHKLFEKYHKIEVDPKISLEEKKKAMKEWWTKHFELLLKSGLKRSDLERVVNSGVVKLRKGALDFLDFLHEHQIPLVIMSSSGLGGDAIKMYLEKHNKMYDNIYVISNEFEWDKNENAVAIKEPIIHVMNKDETMIPLEISEKIRYRKNVFLLGDSLGDVGMAKGYNEIIKVGFLNKNIEENLEQYKKSYDVVLTDDGDFSYMNDFIKKLCN